jgi:hypothetical protein
VFPPETYEEIENWEVNVAPDSTDEDDEDCEGFDETDE